MCSVTSVRVRPIIDRAMLIAMAMISPHLVDLAVRAAHFPIAPFLFMVCLSTKSCCAARSLPMSPSDAGVVSGFLFLVVRGCEVLRCPMEQ